MLKQVKTDQYHHREVIPCFTYVLLTFLGLLVGEIVNWVALDREQHSQHNLKVMVTDQGHPRLNATATVHILITDINDNAPQFTHLPASKELNVQVRIIPLFGAHLLTSNNYCSSLKSVSAGWHHHVYGFCGIYVSRQT